MTWRTAWLGAFAGLLASVACSSGSSGQGFGGGGNPDSGEGDASTGSSGGGSSSGSASSGSSGGSSSGGGSSGGSSGGPSDGGSSTKDAPSVSCASGSVVVTVVDYFSGKPVSAATAMADGTPAGSGSSLCFTVGTGLHPVSIAAGGYATYNGAIQVPGGTTTRTVSLFPVGATLSGWLAQVNSDRQANGAPAVQLDNGLTIAAWDHAVDMGVQGYFAHFDPHGFAPTTRSLLLGSMMMGSENLAAGDATYGDAESSFMAEKSMLPNQSPSDCAQYDADAGHYCNIVATSHNWVGLAEANVPSSPWGTYYDEEFGDLYAYYDTTVLPPEPALGTTGSLTMLPAAGQTFSDEYFATLPTPAAIPIATLNDDPTCASKCPASDQWYATETMFVGGNTPSPFMPSLAQNQIVFAALDTNEMVFVGSAGWAAFWAGGTVLPDTYGASSQSYLVP